MGAQDGPAAKSWGSATIALPALTCHHFRVLGLEPAQVGAFHPDLFVGPPPQLGGAFLR